MENIESSTVERIFGNVLGGDIKHIQLIKKHEKRIIWEVGISPQDSLPEKIILKAIEPVKKSIPEIKIYKKNPYILRCFLPEIYSVRKERHLYWFLMEKLEPITSPQMSLEYFKKPIELLASLHSKFYSKSRIIRDLQLRWVPDFRKENSRKINEQWLTFQLWKNRKNPRAYDFLRENERLLKKVFSKINEALDTLLQFPYSILHGEPVYHHILYKKDSRDMRLIDWSNISFAPVTFDLYFLIDKTFYHEVNPDGKFEESYLLKGLDKNKELSSFRDNCLQYYCQAMKSYSVALGEKELRNWYNLTYIFKTARYLFWNNFKKQKDINSINK